MPRSLPACAWVNRRALSTLKLQRQTSPQLFLLGVGQPKISPATPIRRVARLGRNVGQPGDILANPITSHKAERRPGPADRTLQIILNEPGVGADRRQRARDDPFRLVPPRRRERVWRGTAASTVTSGEKAEKPRNRDGKVTCLGRPTG